MAVERSELSDRAAAELDVFVARRLLTIDAANGSAILRVAHEAFLSAWPPLAEAIASTASALRARGAIEQAAAEWTDNGRASFLLWGGGQLAAAVANTGAHIRADGPSIVVDPPDERAPGAERKSVRLLPLRRRSLVTDHVDISFTARDFIYASIRRDRYRRGRATIILSGAPLTIALLGVIVAIVQQRDAKRQQLIAAGRQLCRAGLCNPVHRSAHRLAVEHCG